MEIARENVLQRQNFQVRLQDVFTSLVPTQNHPAIYTEMFPKENHSLIFTFDQGVDPNPAFGGTVLGKLYLDPQNNLCFALWSIDEKKDPPWRKEILMSHVKKLSFEFLGEKREEKQALNIGLGWHAEWKKERNDLPAIIRMNIEQEGVSLQFAFQLPTSQPIATYFEKGFKS